MSAAAGGRHRVGTGHVRVAGLAVLVALTAVGCGPDANMNMDPRFVNPGRISQGLIVILPGIEGESGANHDIRRGLDNAGIPYALAIYRWGFPVPGVGMFVNQTNAAGNRDAGKRLAQRLVRYQKEHPGRPVFIIGHSGGGGVAVFALEGLSAIPEARPVAGAFLLSASISSDYALANALRMTTRGIVNVHNPQDTGLLGVGTAIFGNVDGKAGDSAGRTGFYGGHANVYNLKITAGGLGVYGDPHYLATNAKVIAEYAPPWILSETWPPAGTSGEPGM